MSSSATSTGPPTYYPLPTITSYRNLGALPTPVTFPPACFSDDVDLRTNGFGMPWTYWTRGCALSTCCPSGNAYSTTFQWYSDYYSPAVCPSGYVPLPADPIITAGVSETVRFCCPSGISDFAGYSNYYSIDPAIQSPTAPYYNWACQDADNPQYSIISVYDNVVDQQFLSTKTPDGYWYRLAYPIQIRYRKEQLQNGTIMTSMSTTTSMLSTATALSASSHSKSGLSAGAIAGVVVGAVAAVALIIGLLAFFRRRRQSRQVDQGPTYTAFEKTELNNDPVSHRPTSQEKGATPTELQAKDAPQELPIGWERQELPADWHRYEAGHVTHS